LDESANEKSGNKSAGAGRQYNGRLGKVEMSQVGTFLSYAKGSYWTWVDGELFLPEHWFASEMTDLRESLGIPPEKTFETKIELGWKMIQRTDANGLPFRAICCDDFYGQSSKFRAQMREDYIYMADVPQDTLVYLEKPVIGIPSVQSGKSGRQSYIPKVISDDKPLNDLAGLKCQRFFVERSIQDAKSEAGWDELQAQKYLAWVHHLSLTILALWFVTQTKIDWAKQHPRDPALLQLLDVDVLPQLSMANVREMLRAAMPLPRFSIEDANELVVKHLVNRTRSRKRIITYQRVQMI
jgi:SRSO17 transposase